jgi:hypothetical protein
MLASASLMQTRGPDAASTAGIGWIPNGWLPTPAGTVDVTLARATCTQRLSAFHHITNVYRIVPSGGFEQVRGSVDDAIQAALLRYAEHPRQTIAIGQADDGSMYLTRVGNDVDGVLVAPSVPMSSHGIGISCVGIPSYAATKVTWDALDPTLRAVVGPAPASNATRLVRFDDR